MKYIRLGIGKMRAMVSDVDAERISRHKWHPVRVKGTGDTGKVYEYGYKAGRSVSRIKKVWMHNEIMRPPKGMEVDHIDGNTLNNTRENLRIVPHWVNCMNKRNRHNKTSKYIGVYKSKDKKKFEAYYWNKKAGKHMHIGYFEDELEAARAHDAVVKRVYGKYACLNNLPS